MRPSDATSHEARVAEIQQRLAREETLHQRAKAAARVERQRADHFAKELGNGARETRTQRQGLTLFHFLAQLEPLLSLTQ